jgi:type II secretory pathway component PulJ
MFGELSQSSVMEVLLFLAIVSLTLVSTFDLFMQAVKQKKISTKNIRGFAARPWLAGGTFKSHRRRHRRSGSVLRTK